MSQRVCISNLQFYFVASCPIFNRVFLDILSCKVLLLADGTHIPAVVFGYLVLNVRYLEIGKMVFCWTRRTLMFQTIFQTSFNLFRLLVFWGFINVYEGLDCRGYTIIVVIDPEMTWL